MCQIEGCNKRAFAVCLNTGVLICIKHWEIRPRFRVLNDPISKRMYKLEKLKKKFPSIHESKEIRGKIIYV